MFCINCGKPVGENDRFCAYCGSEVDFRVYQNAGEQSGESDQAAGVTADSAAGYGMDAFGITDTVRKFGSSTLFFAGIILAAVSAVLTFISALSDVSRYAPFFGADEASIITAGVSVGGAAELIMAAVSIAGMMMFYASNKNGGSGAVKTRGLSVVRVMKVIECILMIAFSAVVLAAGIFVIILFSVYGAGFGEDEAVAIGLIIFYLVIMLIVLIFTDIFYVKLLKTVKSILNTARTGIITGIISLYVIVLLFIIAFIDLVMQILFAGGIVSIICALFEAAVNVVFAIILIKYRQFYENAGGGQSF